MEHLDVRANRLPVLQIDRTRDALLTPAMRKAIDNQLREGEGYQHYIARISEYDQDEYDFLSLNPQYV